MEKLKEGSRQLVAGGSAGLVEVCIMHPLDLIKTRLQLTTQDKGMLDCIQKTIKSEGLRGFYKGILPPILAETPKRATKFFTFEQFKTLFSMQGVPPALTLSIAGLFSGLSEAIVICPFEVIKVRLQSMRGSSLAAQPTTSQMAREIIRTEGMGTKGIYRGLTSTLLRHGVWNMVYFGLYHNLKVFVPDQKQSPSLNLFYRFTLGFAAGSLASVINIPFDVAKSKTQGPQPDPRHRKYNGCLDTIRIVYREEGGRSLYKGLVPKLMRLGPGGAIMLIVYDEVNEVLKTLG